jgi:chromosome segregation ATPase
MPYKDPEKKKAYDKAYREATREERKAQQKTYREANREKKKAYRKANSEAIREKRKAYRKANREAIKEKNKAYYEANREKIKEMEKAYREANREAIREKKKAYHEANPEKKKAQDKAYRETNREKVVIKERRRRAKLANAYVPLNEKEKKYQLDLELARIALQEETGRKYHLDHILPIAHGGIEHPVNWRLMDGKENVSKNAKILPEAVRLAPIQYRLYLERVGPERARQFVLDLAKGLGVEVNVDKLGKITRKKKLTLEDLFE